MAFGFSKNTKSTFHSVTQGAGLTRSGSVTVLNELVEPFQNAYYDYDPQNNAIVGDLV